MGQCIHPRRLHQRHGNPRHRGQSPYRTVQQNPRCTNAVSSLAPLTPPSRLIVAPSLLSRLVRIHPPRQSLFALSVSRRSSTVLRAAPPFVLRDRWLPVQLGVGIPFGCQIGTKGAQCAFVSRIAVSIWDVQYGTAPRYFFRRLRSRPSPSTVLCMGLWPPNSRVGWSATGVKQGDPAGPLYFAVSTYPLFCSIRDAVDRVVGEYFPLKPSYTGVSAICDDLQVPSDPQLALPVSEVVQRKFMEPQPEEMPHFSPPGLSPFGGLATRMAPRYLRCNPR
jgi:hypothetical protein